MINPEELAICRRRGHDLLATSSYWLHCKQCGMWVRHVTTVEEREDDPPEAEQSPLSRMERLMRKAD